jgi:cytochrome P450
MTTARIPAHVPPELVRDFDYYDLAAEPDVFRHFARLHDGPDIVYTPHHGGHWIATRYDDIERILGEPELFSSRHQTVPVTPVHVTLLEDDGALHADLRQLLQPYFSPRHVGELEKNATALTRSLIDGFYASGRCEFTQDFALRMPISLVMNLCELPEQDTPYLIQISDDMVRSRDVGVQQAAFSRVFQYFAESIIPARRARPGRDMISAIVHGRVEGGRALSDAEVLGLCSLLIAGGLDTVASMLGFIALFLARSPRHRQQLIDEPALLVPALEELMRRHHIANVARVVTRDVDFRGVPFRAGDLVLTPTTLAGIDERHYPNALEVDFTRADKRHLVFGRGPHQCIGSFLARTELRVFLTEWLRRIPHFEVEPGAQPVVLAGKANRVQFLPLVWDVH